MKEVYLMRHSMTDWHIERRMIGVSDIPLNQCGVNMVYKVINEIKNKGIDVIVTSDLIRAKQTGEIIKNELKIPMFSFSALNERNQGKLEGKLYKDIFQIYPDLDFSTMIEEREDIISFAQRSSYSIELVTTMFSANKILIVAHNGILRTFVGKKMKEYIKTWDLCECKLVRYHEDGTWKLAM